MRYQTRFALRHTLIVISALLLPALSHADGRIESQRLAYDRALVSIEKQQWAVFQHLADADNYDWRTGVWRSDTGDAANPDGAMMDRAEAML